MPYVDPDDDEDLEASAASEFLSDDDDDDDDDSAIDEAIRNEAKPLTDHAQDEINLLSGIHVWAGVKDALAKTFPGWPDFRHVFQEIHDVQYSGVAEGGEEASLAARHP